MKTLLHVGCGTLRLESLSPYFSAGGWKEIRYDIDPGVEPDVVGDSQDMSIFEDGSFDAIWSAHNIEHVSSFEVPRVLREFRRVLSDTGFLVLLCPDILAVAQAVVDGRIEDPLYTSPAGAITPIDILYGFQHDLQRGAHHMAHKMAFTPDSLARHLMAHGFVSMAMVRDAGYGLTTVAWPRKVPQPLAQETVQQVVLQPEYVTEGRAYGEFA